MSQSASPSMKCAVIVQTMIALALFVLLAAAPPARGALLIVAVGGRSQAELTTLAVAHGASLLRRGPLPSSLIVYGERDRLAWPLARAGVLTVNGGAVGCGDPDAEVGAVR
jgi:hypothetical protein